MPRKALDGPERRRSERRRRLTAPATATGNPQRHGNSHTLSSRKRYGFRPSSTARYPGAPAPKAAIGSPCYGHDPQGLPRRAATARTLLLGGRNRTVTAHATAPPRANVRSDSRLDVPGEHLRHYAAHRAATRPAALAASAANSRPLEIIRGTRWRILR